MNTEVVKIAFMHLILLATQAFYMYLSNKKQFRSNKKLYIIALPLVTALPVILYSQAQAAYTVYEYAIVFCFITAAIADISYAAAFNKEFFSDQAIRSLHYSFFIICLAVSFCAGTGILIKVLTAVILAAAFFFLCIMKKHSPAEFVKAVPLALFSFICSWAFTTYVI